MIKFSKFALMVVGFSILSFSAQAKEKTDSVQVAAVSSAVLQLDIQSSCSEKGAVFKITNNGDKWPRTAMLRLYTADNQSVISERRLRLALGQKVTFLVKNEISDGRPVGLWIEPDWYKRGFKFDATINCN